MVIFYRKGWGHALNGAMLIPFLRCTTHVPNKGVHATNAVHGTGNGVGEKGTIIEHGIFVGKGLGNSLTQASIHSCEKCIMLSNTLYINRVYNPELGPSSGCITRNSKSFGFFNPNSVRVPGYNTRFLSPGYGEPGIQTQPCVRATGYCCGMAQCALQRHSARHSARYGLGSWVCNPMS